MRFKVVSFKVVSLSRGISFSVGRRLFNPAWSQSRNHEVYGVDVRPHGHEYRLEVAYRGPISAQDGMITNLADLKPVMEDCVAPLRDSWLEGEAPGIGRPTAENIALFLWDALPNRIAAATLYRLRLEQSRRDAVEIEIAASRPMATPPAPSGLSARNSYTMKVCRSYEFAAAHRLWVPALSDAENLARFDKCSNPAGHGHNYGLSVWVEGAPDPETGYVIAPALLDRCVETEVYARFDHKHLNVDCPEFTDAGLVPTSENLALLIFQLLGARLAREGHALARVGLRETQKNYFEVEA